MYKKLLIVLCFTWIIPQGISWQTYIDMFPNIRELAKVESGNKQNPMGNPKAYNPKDTDGRPKYSLLQFGWWEFHTWAKLAELEDADIKNPFHQIIVARWAEDNNMLNKWGPFKRLVREGKIILE